MAESHGTSSQGSLILQIVIAILIVTLLISILYPKKLWNEQAREESICRDRMENLFYAAQFYNRETRSHSEDLIALKDFASSKTITIMPPGFKMDRLTREETGIDSFQLEFFDPFQHFNHYERAVRIEHPLGKVDSGPDSVVLSTVPKSRYPFLPITRYTFAADVPITAIVDERGDQGCFALVGAQGVLRYTQILGEPVEARAEDYLFFIDPAGMENCPTTNSMYDTQVNVKLTIEAVIQMTLEKTPPPNPVSQSKVFSSNIVFRLLKEADAAAKRVMLQNKVMEAVEDSLLNDVYIAYLDSTSSALRNRGQSELASAIYDSTLDDRPLPEETQRQEWEKIRDTIYDRMNSLKVDSAFSALRDGIVNVRKNIIVDSEFVSGLERIRKECRTAIIESGTVSTTSDSIEFYSNPDLIRNRLVREKSDSVTVAHMAFPSVQTLLEMFSMTEVYRTVKTDSVGITIACPIQDRYLKPNRSILDRIFSVGGSENHGNVHNGDLSWSEKR